METTHKAGTANLEVGLLLAGGTLMALLHTTVMWLLGWPSARDGIPLGISIAHGFQWGLGGMALLVVGAILVGPLGGRSLAQNMRVGAHFLYGAFLAHALFDLRFGGDWIDPVLYSASAATVVRFAVFVFQVTMKDAE